MAELPEAHQKPLTTFLSLPREIRQQILFYTFHDAYLADLDHNYETHQSAYDLILETPNMSARSHDLASTHPTISVDVQFVAEKWRIITIDSWEGFCYTKLVQRVKEACERVHEQFRLQDEATERAYLSQTYVMDAEPEELSSALDGWNAFGEGE